MRNMEASASTEGQAQASQSVSMTAEELAEFAAYKEAKAKKEAEEKEKSAREEYRRLVDEEIRESIPVLQDISDEIKACKGHVMDNFRTIVEMKSELFRSRVKDDQRSHTFTSSDGKMRITLGVYVTDGYQDTVEDGIDKVKQYIESLAKDEKTKALVNMVMRLLARDAQGTLKASRIVQLRKIAEETGDEEFKTGVKIIEESYQPSISKQFIRAEVRDERGAWTSIPLGMTEC